MFDGLHYSSIFLYTLFSNKFLTSLIRGHIFCAGRYSRLIEIPMNRIIQSDGKLYSSLTLNFHRGDSYISIRTRTSAKPIANLKKVYDRHQKAP